MYGSSLHRDKVILHDEEVYKAFLGKVKKVDFISSTSARPLPEDNSGTYLKLELTSSNEFKSYTRTDYNILQFIGDVGALFGTLKDLISLFLSFVLRYEFYLSAHLINNVFTKRGRPSADVLYPRHHYEYFKCVCRLCKRRTTRELNHVNKVGSRRIDRELDIIYFLKKQMMVSALLNSITTKNQRVLARKNYRFKINTKLQKGQDPPSDDESTPESGNEFDQKFDILESDTSRRL